MEEEQFSFQSFKEKFDDQLTCNVCLDQYTDPKTLPCHHSFCLKCIEPLLADIKDGDYISCPTCRADHQMTQGSAVNLPNAFHINSLLEVRKNMVTLETTQQPTTSSNCPKHNDHPLKVYCETCCKVICCECAMTKDHQTHTSSRIAESYPKHKQQILDSLNKVKRKLKDANTAVTHLATREKEVLCQGQQLKEQIDTHAQQIIDQVKKSHTNLSQQVETIVRKKAKNLAAQRQQAQKLHTKLDDCRKIIEHSLKEWDQLQILKEKKKMMEKMNAATAVPAVLQPEEKADIQLEKKSFEKDIGVVSTAPLSTSTATPTPQSHDSQPLSSSRLSSQQGQSNVTPTTHHQLTQQSHNGQPLSSSTLSSQQGQSNVTPTTHHQRTGPVGGAASPSTTPAMRSPETIGKPIMILTGLKQPMGLAVFDNGNVVVAEWGAHCVTILNKEGRKVKSFGTKGTNKGQFRDHSGVAITKDGHILVTDNHRIQKLTTDGACVKSVGGSNSGSGRLQFNHPAGITVHHSTGQIFVADYLNNRIQVFTSDLTFSHSITAYHFKPYDVALDNEGYLYVAEWRNHWITKLTTKGQHIARFGAEGSAPGQLYEPSSLTINNNLLYVTEWGNKRISIFNTTGKFLHCFGKKGSGKEEFDGPCKIATDTLSNLYVSDTRNNKMLVF